MAAAVAYGLRRTSARVVLAFVLGGLVFVVYRAVHVDALGPYVCFGFSGRSAPLCTRVLPTSTSWDLVVGAVSAVAALVVAAALWYARPVRR